MVRRFFAGLALLTMASAANAAVVPVGPQTAVPESTVLNTWGWAECYSATYATPLGATAAGALSNCGAGDYLMLAARMVGSDVFTVLAAALRTDVLTNTGPSDNGVTTAANGAEWYYADGWSWGFAGLGDTVEKDSCDIAGPTEEDRLCWHVDAGVGGYRAGAALGLNSSTDWEKVILVMGAVVEPPREPPEPGTFAVIGLGLAGLAVARRRTTR